MYNSILEAYIVTYYIVTFDSYVHIVGHKKCLRINIYLQGRRIQIYKSLYTQQNDGKINITQINFLIFNEMNTSVALSMRWEQFYYYYYGKALLDNSYPIEKALERLYIASFASRNLCAIYSM